MSRRPHVLALQEVRAWKTDDVLRALEKNGFSDCCEAFRKRDIDGENLLGLTEGKLALWKRDLTLSNIRLIARFVEDLQHSPEKFLLQNSDTSNNNHHSQNYNFYVRDPTTANNTRGFQLGNTHQNDANDDDDDVSSWGTEWDDDNDYINDDIEIDLSNDMASENSFGSTDLPPKVQNNQQQSSTIPVLANGVTSSKDSLKPVVLGSNQQKQCATVEPSRSWSPATRNARPPGPKPPVPARPPPKLICSRGLPKPPALEEEEYNQVKCLVGNLSLPLDPRLASQFDDDFYESFDQDTEELPQMIHDNLKITASTSTLSSISSSSTNIPKAASEPDGYESDKYESIEEDLSWRFHPNPPPMKSDMYDSESYLEPRARMQPLPPNPIKLKCQVPLTEPPPPPMQPTSPEIVSTPPRKKKNSSEEKQGNKISTFLGRWMSNNPPDQERTPTPELKKVVPPPVPPAAAKPPIPPPVDQRPPAVPPIQRPLPPTPEGIVLSSHNVRINNNNGIGATRPSTNGYLNMPWYHNVERKQAEDMVRNGENGYFVIRPCSQPQNPLTLTLWYNNRVYNIVVRHRPDGRYALGTEKVNEQSFTSVEEMVANYQRERLVLYSGGEKTGTTVLTTSPRKDMLPKQ